MDRFSTGAVQVDVCGHRLGVDDDAWTASIVAERLDEMTDAPAILSSVVEALPAG